jgi:peptide/nickel transport system substrate-binding protein
MRKSVLGVSKTRGLSRVIAIIIVVILLVAAAVAALYVASRPPSLSVSVSSPSNSVGVVGENVSFTAVPSVSGAKISQVTWNFGDGTTKTASGTTVSHVYSDPGSYLISASISTSYTSLFIPYTISGTSDKNLYPLQIQDNLSQAQGQNVSVPTINFETALNPGAPVFSVGDVVHPAAGYLELPPNSFWSIEHYTWNFGNGVSEKVVQANSSGNSLPLSNVTTSYSSPGLYPLALTLTTGNSTIGQTANVTTIHTVAVESSSTPFAIAVASSGVLNPNTITSVEVEPGGPYSWDPQVDYDIVGFEELENVFQTLVQYNGSSTSSFIPNLAAFLPSTANGGITDNSMQYTFTLRSNQYFSNGDPVTAYDVWFSLARGLAFANGSPGTPDWIQDQFLVPGVQNGTASVYTNNTWAVATNEITYSNSSNTVTLHLNAPEPSSLIFQVMANPEGAGIVDAKYACSVGACFNEATWNSYMNQADAGSYNTGMQWSPIGSGPFMIESYTPGESVELVANPHYGGVPGIPAVGSKTVVIDWVKSPDTALLMLEDGQADSVTGLPPSDFPAVQTLQSKGFASIYNFGSYVLYFYPFNINVSKSAEAAQLGPGYNEPANYFADVPTRLAWINAFDYLGYLNNILGNSKYGATFGTGYQGVIPPGMEYFTNASQLGGLPQQNLNFAKGNFSISAFASQTITIPITVPTGDPVDLASAEEWAGTLSQISNGHIIAKVVQLPATQMAGDLVPNQNPMAVSLNEWAPDYPDPADYANAMLLAGGYYPGGSSWVSSSSFSYAPIGNAPTGSNDVVHINGTAYPQDEVYQWINNNVTAADNSLNGAVRQYDYEVADKLAIDMGLYVFVYDAGQYVFWRSYMTGISAQENPIVDSGGIFVYYAMSK